MTTQQATAEVFWTAFKGLPKAAREGFISRLVLNPQLRRELEDGLDNMAADLALRDSRRIPWDTLKKSLKR